MLFISFQNQKHKKQVRESKSKLELHQSLSHKVTHTFRLHAMVGTVQMKLATQTCIDLDSA